MDAAGVPVPVIDSERCVHALASFASCARCADACPQQALQLTDTSLTFDEERCTGCGHCRPACPEAAISFPSLSLSPVVDREAREAFLACHAAVPEGGAGTIPCLHAVTEQDLTALANNGAGRLHIARAQCETCAHKAVTGIGERARAVNLMQTARGLPAIALLEEAPQSWRKHVARALADGRTLDTGRRALFSSFLRHQVPQRRVAAAAPNVARFALHIDEAACTGCDACARICPHGAIALARDEQGLAYSIAAQACTNCGLCTDLCEAGAVRILPFAAPRTARVALAEHRCTRCGVPFHEPVREGALTAGHDRCRICQGQTQAAKLFEVRR